MVAIRRFFCPIFLLISADGAWKAAIDVAILIDTSPCVDVATSPVNESEIGSNDTYRPEETPSWTEVLNFCERLGNVSHKIGYNDTLLGLITFGENSSIDLHWRDCRNKASFAETLHKLRGRSDDFSSRTDVASGLILYDKWLYGGHVNKSNYIIVILRGCIDQCAKDAAREALREITDKIIIIDLRPAANKIVWPFSRTGGEYYDSVINELNATAVSDRIKFLECEYREKYGADCYYVDESRKNCRTNELDSLRPAEKYNQTCGATRKPAEIRCPLKHCEKTCDQKRAWGKCEPFQCDENITVFRKSWTKSSDVRLQFCRESKILECPPCNTTPLPEHLVHMIMGYHFGMLVVTTMVAIVMLTIHCRKTPEKKLDLSPKTCLTPVKILVEKPSKCD